MTYRAPRSVSICAVRCIVVGLLALVPPASAQEPNATRTVVKTGLHGLYARHTMIATLVDVAEPGAPPTEVVVRFFDDRDNLLKSARGVLEPGRSVELRLQHRELRVRQRRVPVRTEVEMVREGDGSGNVPILSVELFDPALDFVAPGRDCPVPFPEPGANPQVFNCGCHIESSPVVR